MKLFRRSRFQMEPARTTDAPPTPIAPTPFKKPRQILLNAEEKGLLERPLDLRVDHILQEIYADRAPAKAALKARRTSPFQVRMAGSAMFIHDEHGLWRIVPRAVPRTPNQFFDAL